MHSKLRFGSLNVDSVRGRSMEVAEELHRMRVAVCRKHGGKEVLQGLLMLT